MSSPRPTILDPNVPSVVAATIVPGVYAAARYASLLSAQQHVAGGQRPRPGARRELMHRRLVLVAFVFAITFVLVCPFPLGPVPRATAAQSATPGVASVVPASGD